MRLDRMRRLVLVTVGALLLAGAASSRGDSSGATAAPATARDSAAAALPARRGITINDSLLKAMAADTGTVVGEPEIFLSWHRPYGTPGALGTVTAIPGDTNTVDTLYLSFDPGRTAPRLYAVYTRLLFHPRMGDTLGNYWHWEHGSWNQANMRMEFDPDGTFPGPQPFGVPAYTSPKYVYDRGVGELTVVNAVAVENAGPVKAGTRYCLGRIMLRHKQAWLSGSTQPVCVEWAEARLSFGSRDVVVTKGAHRWVAMNAPDDGLCGDYRRYKAPTSWRPKAPTGP
jgi:hypothetical protein